jgi:uncharacterized membrane protein YeaQ/YmgE (transglycosylase-associated protein family)
MRTVIGICATVGTIVGSYLPQLWGASSLSLASLFFGAVGGITGVLLAARLQS